MNRLLELDLLRTLIVVSENGSFTRAAEVLSRTQAAVSMQIRRLEELCGAILIARNKREFRLTNEGEILVAHGKRMLILNDDAVADLSPLAVSGTIRVAAPDMYAVHILPPLLVEFSSIYPDVQIQLQSGVTQHDVLETLGGRRRWPCFAKARCCANGPYGIWRKVAGNGEKRLSAPAVSPCSPRSKRVWR
jgi:DNA-binding transcriptional LysR family regulator